VTVSGRLSRRRSKPCGTLSDATSTYPFLKQLVEGRVGSVTFAEIAEALASVDVSDRDPDWRAEWAELIETIKRAARVKRRSA